MNARSRTLICFAALCAAAPAFADATIRRSVTTSAQGTPLQHIIIIMQENRSFDNYFGTYPGADGIPAGTCIPYNPAKPSAGCITPFHDPHDVNAGGPHGAADAFADLDNGVSGARMDGFVLRQGREKVSGSCNSLSPGSICQLGADGKNRHDAAGYHTADEISNYWTYAQHFVLQDRLFEGVRGWSGAAHLQLLSEWSAKCSDPHNAMTCQSTSAPTAPSPSTQYPWVNLMQLMDLYGVTWKYYIARGSEPDCDDDASDCAPVLGQSAQVPSFWNPVPFFAWVKVQGAAYLSAHDADVDQFLVDVQNNTLPQVAWIVPNGEVSEHSPYGITAGVDYVTSLVNAVMQSAAWSSSAIFISWDDWGGFYDHVVPPNVDTNATAYPIQGFGLRVPGLMISPYARAGLIDHQLLGFDSYATLIENLFVGGKRLDPVALKNPDNRPTIRDALTSASFPDGHNEPIGDLINEFDFTQSPIPALVLSTLIPPGLLAQCGPNPGAACTLPTVTLTWDPVGAPGTPVTYHVQRDGAELAQCLGTALFCVDTPGSGRHLYRAYTIHQNGVVSPLSAAAEADVP
jgi:phospholipase C